MEVSIGDIVKINGKMAVVTKVFDKKESLKPRCLIKQDGEEYNVFVKDLKPHE